MWPTNPFHCRLPLLFPKKKINGMPFSVGKRKQQKHFLPKQNWPWIEVSPISICGRLGWDPKNTLQKFWAMHSSFSGAFEIAIETRFEFLFCHYLLPSHLSYLNRKRTSHNHQKCKSKNKFPHQTNTYNNNDSRCCLNKFPPPLFQTTLPSPRVPRFPTPKAQANDT